MLQNDINIKRHLTLPNVMISYLQHAIDELLTQNDTRLVTDLHHISAPLLILC